MIDHFWASAVFVIAVLICVVVLADSIPDILYLFNDKAGTDHGAGTED